MVSHKILCRGFTVLKGMAIRKYAFIGVYTLVTLGTVFAAGSAIAQLCSNAWSGGWLLQSVLCTSIVYEVQQ